MDGYGKHPLPYSVNDDNGQPWSDHLAGAPAAWEHYQFALEHGIVEPTITDKNGEDITKWVSSVCGNGYENRPRQED